VSLQFHVTNAVEGTLLAIGEPFVGPLGEHRPVRLLSANGGAVLIVQEVGAEQRKSELLRLDGLQLGRPGAHKIDVTLGEGRISVAVDGLPPRSGVAGPRPSGHIKIDGHGDSLHYTSLGVTGRIEPRWVLNDTKVRRLLTVRER